MRQQTPLSSFSGPALFLGRWGLIFLWVAIGMILGEGTSVVRAQYGPSQIQEPPPALQAETGIRLLQADQIEEALPLLEGAMTVDSSLTVAGHGALAYWLGEAYARSEEPAKAQSTWQSGMHALKAEGDFDVRLADAYLKSLTPQQLRGERLQAVEIYESLLSRVTPDTSSALQNVFRRRVAQIVPLLSDDILANVIEEDRSAEAETWTFQPDAGSTLQDWWRGLDPLPDTEENERMEEHLGRLVLAQQEYECPARPSALDDRGIVHLRFGSPFKQRPIDYEDGEFFREVFTFGVHVSSSDFPASEIWLYPHIDDYGFYLFAEEDTSDCYEIAKANDLLPSHLKMGRGDNERGLNIAFSAMMAMRAIYRELALYHINFSGRYNEIADYAAWQEMKGAIAEAAERTGGAYQPSFGEQSVEVPTGGGQTRRIFRNSVMGIDFPTRFVPRMVARAEQEDAVAAQRREEAMPRQHTTLLDGAARLPVDVRTARFLNEDGTTRTEVYWGIPKSALALEGGEEALSSLLTLSAVRYNEGHESRQRVERRYQLDAQADEEEQVVLPPPITLEGTSEPYHVGMQWTQYQIWSSDSTTEGVDLGPKRRLATARADSLQPLRAEGSRIEMSDVKVLLPPDTASHAVNDLVTEASPYPFETLAPGTPLLLSFEIYHLAYDADDRTRYTISYEAEGRRQRGWTRLFRGEDVQRTSTEMTMEGSDRRTQEAILLDLSQIDQEDTQDVQVTVRVTDEVTGTTVTRDLDFVLEPGDP